MIVDDCVEGLHGLMASDCALPLGLDTGAVATLDQLVKVVAAVADKTVRLGHNQSMPQGVRDCSSDNALLRPVLGWEPQVSLMMGLPRTYVRIPQQLARCRAALDDRAVARATVSGPVREPLITAA
jgi:GDP-D-mannose 3',5'-epimerase